MQPQVIMRRLDQVIRTDATIVSRADFLATHTPFRQLKYQRGGAPEKVIDEDELLRSTLLEAPEIHRLVVIRGDQGTGKSHVIRWLKERYVHYSETNNDVILFITRAENTLRGALEQIVQSKVFSEDYRQNELKKLIEANQHLSETALKRKIVLSFARIASEFAESEMNNRFGRHLFPFMVDETILEFLCRPGSAVERIHKRLSPDGSNQRVDDVEPRFFPDDFKLDYQQLTQMQQGEGAGSARRLAQEIADAKRGPALRELISKFLNNHIDEVVQECTNLNVSDLKKVFARLRCELKKMQKGLILFIEDITSFTGIDRALMEVLIQEHTGSQANEQLCRICSIVGVTKDYFDTGLPDNIKERVTHKMTIDQDSYGDEYLLEMTARYLNAIYLSTDVISSWVNEGAIKENLPISELYREHHWAMYQIPDGPKLTIFPFNQNAVLQSYARLRKLKTPRHLLQDVISFITREFIGRVNEPFPPPESEIQGEFSIPQWAVPTHAGTVDSQNLKYSDNIACLLRLWGNATAFRREIGDRLTVGDLDRDVFNAFQLPFIEGVKDGINPKSVSNTPGQKTIQEPTPSNSSTVNVQEVKFKRIQKELQDWVNGKSLVNYGMLRDNALNALKDFIDWEEEKIPGNVLNAFTTKRFSIEDQTGLAHEGFQIKRSKKAQAALMALAAWQYIGSKSWNFTDSDEYLGQLYRWMEEVKNDFIKAVSRVHYYNDGKFPCGSWTVLAAYYGVVIGGQLGERDSIREIYVKMTQPWRDITVNELRSSKWRGLQQKSKKFAENHNFFLEYFNRKQGDITHGSSIYFLDAAEILRVMDDWNRSDWNTEVLEEELFSNLKDEIIYYPLQVLQEIRKQYNAALLEELEESARVKAAITASVGDISKEGLDGCLNAMRQFLALLQEANESYPSQTFEKLTSGNITGIKLAAEMSAVERFITAQGALKHKLASAFPMQRLQPASVIFTKFNELVDQKIVRFNDKITVLEQSSEGADVNDLIKQVIDWTSTLAVNLKSACEEEFEC